MCDGGAGEGWRGDHGLSPPHYSHYSLSTSRVLSVQCLRADGVSKPQINQGDYNGGLADLFSSFRGQFSAQKNSFHHKKGK